METPAREKLNSAIGFATGLITMETQGGVEQFNKVNRSKPTSLAA